MGPAKVLELRGLFRSAARAFGTNEYRAADFAAGDLFLRRVKPVDFCVHSRPLSPWRHLAEEICPAHNRTKWSKTTTRFLAWFKWHEFPRENARFFVCWRGDGNAGIFDFESDFQPE